VGSGDAAPGDEKPTVFAATGHCGVQGQPDETVAAADLTPCAGVEQVAKQVLSMWMMWMMWMMEVEVDGLAWQATESAP
jgi:hypothetical protein